MGDCTVGLHGTFGCVYFGLEQHALEWTQLVYLEHQIMDSSGLALFNNFKYNTNGWRSNAVIDLYTLRQTQRGELGQARAYSWAHPNLQWFQRPHDVL